MSRRFSLAREAELALGGRNFYGSSISLATLPQSQLGWLHISVWLTKEVLPTPVLWFKNRWVSLANKFIKADDPKPVYQNSNAQTWKLIYVFLVIEERLSTKVLMKFSYLTNFPSLWGQANYSFILIWFTDPYTDFFLTNI